jgi:methyl-accepting chemotaxis protein
LSDINNKTAKISAQAQDMASIAQQSAASMDEISAAGEEQLASVEETANSCKELLSLSEHLNVELNKFKLK